MHAIYRRRLERLASFLETLPRRKFNMCSFGEQEECGTVACAAGWAGMMPEFRRVGFKLTFGEGKYWGNLTFDPVTKFDKENQRWSSDYSDSFTKVADFFGMEYDDVSRLFDQGGPYGDKLPTPKRVAKELRKFLRNKSKEKITHEK